MELEEMFNSLKGNETIFFKACYEMSYSIIQGFYFVLESIFMEFSNFLNCPSAVAIQPEKTPNLIQFDFIVGVFHPGKKVFRQEGIEKFWFEEDDQAILHYFALRVLNRNEIEKINLCLAFLLLVRHGLNRYGADPGSINRFVLQKCHPFQTLSLFYMGGT